MLKITDGIYCIEGLRMGRVYMIEGADGLTIIDTSIANATPQISKELESIGKKLSDVKRILITHAHPDHIGSLSALQAATSAKVYAQPKEAQVITGQQPVKRPRGQDLPGAWKIFSNMPNPQFPATRVDREIVEGDTLDEVLPGLTVVDLPGHAPGQVGFWYGAKSLLIAADAVMRYGGKMRPPLIFVTPDMAEAHRSVRKMVDMKPELLCMGHGAPYLGDATAALNEFATRLHLMA